MPTGQSLDKPLPNRAWQASAAMRMMELLRTTEVRLGLHEKKKGKRRSSKKQGGKKARGKRTGAQLELL